MTDCTHDLGSPDQIPLGEGRVFRVDGLEVAVFRARDGGTYATQAACPHRGGPLADGLIGGGTLICPLHARAFDLATGRPVGNSCAPLVTYPIALEGGRLVLTLDVSRTGRLAASATP